MLYNVGMAERKSHVRTSDAANILGVSSRQVCNLIHKGILPAEKFGRDFVIRRADLAKVPKDRKPGPKAKKPK